MAKLSKKETRRRRHMSIRNRIHGSSECPRLCVWASSRHLRIQLVDDAAGRTLAAVSTDEKELRQTGCRANVENGAKVGKLLAERALAKDIKNVVFDRGGFHYHGVIKAVADGARENGLVF